MSASRNADAASNQPGQIGSHIERDEPLTTKGVSFLPSTLPLHPTSIKQPNTLTLNTTTAQTRRPSRQRRRPRIPRQNPPPRLRTRRPHFRPKHHILDSRPSAQRRQRPPARERKHQNDCLVDARRRYVRRCAYRLGASRAGADE